MTKKLIIAAIILVAILAFTILIRKWIIAKKKRDLEQSGIDLGKIQGLSAGDAERIVSGLSKAELQKQKQIVDGTPVIELANAIHSAKSLYNDDEDLVYTTLGRLKSKASLAFLSDYFQKTYKISLIAYLQSFLSAEEQGIVNNILKKLK